MSMTEQEQNQLVEKLVDAFLAWPLPESVNSDGCATMRGYPHRSGTNLLTAIEARQMFEYVLAKIAAVHDGKWNELKSERETLCKSLKECVFFLEDYLRTTTHPGVSRLIADAKQALQEFQ